MKRWLVTTLALVCSSTAVLADEKLFGRWEGLLTCDSAEIQMTLSIKEMWKGNFSGELNLQAGGQSASYKVDGKYLPNSFQIQPGNWKIPGFQSMYPLRGKIVQEGGRDTIKGDDLRECNKGSFTAYLKAPPSTAPADRLYVEENYWKRKGPAFVKGIRDRTQQYAQKRESDQQRWKILENEVIHSLLEMPTRESLWNELKQARANIGADALLAELAAVPKTFPKGVGRAIFVISTAYAMKWPDEVTLRVHKACLTHATESLRPMLKEVAVLAQGQPSLDTLMKVREKLAPIETFRQSLESAFGTIDPENVLAPMAKLEANPAVQKEFRAALAEARQTSTPRKTTEEVIFSVLGLERSSSSLDPIAAEGRRLASRAEVIVENYDSDESDSEPTAEDIADWQHGWFELVNRRLAAQRCEPGSTHDIGDYAKCEFGKLVLRLERVSKTNCEEQTPGLVYICDFDRQVNLVHFRTGEPARPGSLSISYRKGAARVHRVPSLCEIRQAMVGSVLHDFGTTQPPVTRLRL